MILCLHLKMRLTYIAILGNYQYLILKGFFCRKNILEAKVFADPLLNVKNLQKSHHYKVELMVSNILASLSTCLIYLNNLYKNEDENWYFCLSLYVGAFR